jgi:hypothetical protein
MVHVDTLLLLLIAATLPPLLLLLLPLLLQLLLLMVLLLLMAQTQAVSDTHDSTYCQWSCIQAPLKPVSLHIIIE